MKPHLILYEFSARSVARRDLDPFQKLYALHQLPVGSALQVMMGSMVFSLAKYQEDQRELYTIAEVRRFHLAFHQAWPYWLYFCDLDQDDLKTMTLGCLSSLAVTRLDGQSNGAIAYDRRELDRFVQGDLKLLQELSERAELSTRAVAQRIQAVLAYFQLRFHPTIKT